MDLCAENLAIRYGGYGKCWQFYTYIYVGNWTCPEWKWENGKWTWNQFKIGPVGHVKVDMEIGHVGNGKWN